MDMSFKEDLSNTSFIATAELNPPKSFECEKILENASKLKGLVSAINITDNSGASVKVSSMTISHLIKRDFNIEPIWQITCRDRNRLAVQSDLLSAKVLGLSNILPLRGDELKQGDYPDAKASFDLNTEELIQVIKQLEKGRDLAMKELKPHLGDFSFCVGSAAHPGVPDLVGQRETMLRRLDLGVEFFQTQICFDLSQLEIFKNAIGEKLASKTLLGITPIKSLKQAEFMHKNIWGVAVPDYIFSELTAITNLDPDSTESLEAQREIGLKFSQQICKRVQELGFKGIHLMAIGQEANLADILKRIMPESAFCSKSFN